MTVLSVSYLHQLWDGPYCRTQDQGGAVGYRSNSSHHTYTQTFTFSYFVNLHISTPWSLNPPIPTPKPTNLHPVDVDPTGSLLCSEGLLSVRVYSHQENLLVHLLWSGLNATLIFCCYFCAICFHTALFASEQETVNKTICVLEVIHSLVHPFNHTRVSLEAERDHLFSWVLVRLFGPYPSVIAVFTPAQKICTKGGN